jgi:hypothetical protein
LGNGFLLRKRGQRLGENGERIKKGCAKKVEISHNNPLCDGQ